MRVVRSKRGEEDFWNAMTLIVGALVGIFFVFVVYRVTSTERANMVFFTKDAAILTDAILAAPQSVELVYTQEHKFSNKYINFQGDELQLSTSSNASEATPYRHFFIPRGDIRMDESWYILSVVFFIKNQSFMAITNHPGAFSAATAPEAQAGTEQTAAEQTTAASTEKLDPNNAEYKEKLELYLLYTEYLKTQALCFQDYGDCIDAIEKVYAAPCKKFDCICGSYMTAHIDRCNTERPHFIIGMKAPKPEDAPSDPRT